MYHSPGTMEYMASYNQQELLREAQAAQRAHDAGEHGHKTQLVALLVTLLVLTSMFLVL